MLMEQRGQAHTCAHAAPALAPWQRQRQLQQQRLRREEEEGGQLVFIIP